MPIGVWRLLSVLCHQLRVAVLMRAADEEGGSCCESAWKRASTSPVRGISVSSPGLSRRVSLEPRPAGMAAGSVPSVRSDGVASDGC